MGAFGMAAGLGIASIASTAYGISEQHKQAKAQRKIQEEQTNIQKVADARKRRSAIRESRIKRAAIEQASVYGGTTGSTSEGQALGSITQQLQSNLSFLGQTEASANRISGYSQQIADSQTRQMYGQAVGSVTGSIFQGMGGWQSVFSETPQTSVPTWDMSPPSSSVPTFGGTR